jgi:hypothetical protein
MMLSLRDCQAGTENRGEQKHKEEEEPSRTASVFPQGIAHVLSLHVISFVANAPAGYSVGRASLELALRMKALAIRMVSSKIFLRAAAGGCLRAATASFICLIQQRLVGLNGGPGGADPESRLLPLEACLTT